MKTTASTRKIPSKKAIALTISAALALISLLGVLGSTLASQSDIEFILKYESDNPARDFIEVGQTKSMTVYNLKQAQISNKSMATMTYTADSGGVAGKIKVTGVKAGEAVIAYGASIGTVNVKRYHITDSNNISHYKIKYGGEIVLSGPGKTRNTPVVVIEGANNIEWSSMNPGIATVDAGTGDITAVSQGKTLIIGEFFDKWGAARNIPILVGVGVQLGDDNVSLLFELITEAETILAKDPNPNPVEYLELLQNAINMAKAALDDGDAGEEGVKDAISELANVIKDALGPIADGVVGPDNSGDYFKAAGFVPNIYEVVNRNGESAETPSYVYSQGGDPVGGAKRAAMPRSGLFYVEDPEVSNIWRVIDESGEVDNSSAMWGGSDGELGADDTKTAELFGDEYWINLGQNVWLKVDGLLTGELTGGGPAQNPVQTPATPIFEHNGVYYLGPLGEDPDYYYYGSKPGGDGLLKSTAAGVADGDIKYFLEDDEMIPELTVITSVTITNAPVGVIDKVDLNGYAFTALVDGKGLVSQDVTWSIQSTKAAGTRFEGNILKLDDSETATTMVVRASSDLDNSVYAEASISIYHLPKIANFTDSTIDFQFIDAGLTYKYTVMKRITIDNRSYAMLIKNGTNMNKPNSANKPLSGTTYEGSSLQAYCDLEVYSNVNNHIATQLRANTVVPDLGGDSLDAISMPTPVLSSTVGYRNTIFPPSYGEMTEWVNNSKLSPKTKQLYLALDTSIIYYWLRTPDGNNSANWYVVELKHTGSDGLIKSYNYSGNSGTNMNNIALRPAMWIRYK